MTIMILQYMENSSTTMDLLCKESLAATAEKYLIKSETYDKFNARPIGGFPYYAKYQPNHPYSMFYFDTVQVMSQEVTLTTEKIDVIVLQSKAHHRTSSLPRFYLATRMQNCLKKYPNMEKHCHLCKKIKSIDQFHSSTNLSYGITGPCKDCCDVIQNAYSLRSDSDLIDDFHDIYGIDAKDATKRCSICKTDQPLIHFGLLRKSCDGLRICCRR